MPSANAAMPAVATGSSVITIEARVGPEQPHAEQERAVRQGRGQDGERGDVDGAARRHVGGQLAGRGTRAGQRQRRAGADQRTQLQRGQAAHDAVGGQHVGGVSGRGAEGEGETDQVEPRRAAGRERDQRAGQRESEGDGGAQAEAVAPQQDGAQRDERRVGGQQQPGQRRVDALHGAQKQRRLEPEQAGAQQDCPHHVARAAGAAWRAASGHSAIAAMPEPHRQQGQQRDALVGRQGGEGREATERGGGEEAEEDSGVAHVLQHRVM